MTGSNKTNGRFSKPNAGTFKKGRSGNPGGRPKGAKGIKTLLSKELKGGITIQENGKKKRVRRSEALVKRMVNDALQGRDRPRDKILQIAESIDQEQQRKDNHDLSADDQAILDRWFERRLSLLKWERGDNDS
jgi:Family of unknown function (DUF5681)